MMYPVVMQEFISTAQAAKGLGLSQRAVCLLARRLAAPMHGGSYLITRAVYMEMKRRPRRGRPRKK